MILAESQRQLFSVGTSVSAPEVDSLPLLTRLLLFAAASSSSLEDVCTVSMIDEEIVRSEADELAHMGAIVCGLSGQLLAESPGRRLWDDFTCVRNYRNERHQMIFDPLARALRWLCPSDSVRMREGNAPFFPSSYSLELKKVPDEILAGLIRDVSPGLAGMISERENCAADVSLGPATDTLTSPLPLPLAMVMLPHPYTAIDQSILNQGGDLQTPLPSQAYSIEGPGLRFQVTVGREGRRERDSATFLFDQVTGVIHEEEDIAGYVRSGPVGQLSTSVFPLLPKYTESELCEALASGLLANLLPERGQRCWLAGWTIDEETVTIQRGATEAAMVESAVKQAEAEGNWRFWGRCTTAPDSLRGA